MAKHRLIVSLCLLFVVLATAPAHAQSSTSDVAQEAQNPEALAATPQSVPVKFRNVKLFDVTIPIGALTPADRAAAIENRLLLVAAGSADALTELRVVERDGLSELYAGELLLRALTDKDAAETGRTRRQLAADQLERIRDALAIEFRDRSAANILRSALYSIAATIVLFSALFGLTRLHRWSRNRINRAAQAWTWESGLGWLKILSPATVTSVSRSIAASLSWLIGIALVYFFAEYVLSLFPWTRGFADQMVTISRAAVVHVGSGFINYLPNLLRLIVIVVVARFVLRGLRTLFDQIRAERLTIGGFYAEWAMPTYSLVRFFVIAIAAVMVFPYLPGSGSEGFRGVSVFVGLLLSLGAASAIANVIAGVVITYMRPFKPGDRVKIADAVGDITDKNLLVVRLRTIKNVDITIPNSLVLANHIVNYSSSASTHGLILNTTVTIGYDVPWPKVHDLLQKAASQVEGVLAKPAPYILQTSLDDFYVSYELNAYTDRPNEMAGLYSALHTKIQDMFNAASVEIMSPHYTAVRDGNHLALPEDHLPKNYRAPAFNVLSRLLHPESGS